jgi:uncharacterized protein YbdZ (MbtH family)
MDNSRDEYRVLVNEEEQYSLWSAFKEIPEGWRQVGPAGSKEVCFALRERDLDRHAAPEYAQAGRGGRKAALPNGLVCEVT